MSNLERFSEYGGFGLERFHCTNDSVLADYIPLTRTSL